MNSSKPPPLSSSEAKQALGAAASGGGAEETERLVPEEASRPPTPRDEFGIRISEFAQFAQVYINAHSPIPSSISLSCLFTLPTINIYFHEEKRLFESAPAQEAVRSKGECRDNG